MKTVKLVLVLAMWLAKAGHSECIFFPPDIIGEIIPPEKITTTDPTKAKVELKCWYNQVENFKVRCWKKTGIKGNSYEAILYHYEQTLNKWNVESCGLNLLNSLNLAKTRYGAVIYVIHTTTECREVAILMEEDFVKSSDSMTPCPSTVFRLPRVNNRIYSNGWQDPTGLALC